MLETDLSPAAEGSAAAGASPAPGADMAPGGQGVLLKASADGAGAAEATGSVDPSAKADEDHRARYEAEALAERQRHWDDFQRHSASERLRESQDWYAQCQQDPELGKDKLDMSVARAQLALNRFDPDRQVGQWLQQSGFGNHPEVLRLFNRIADALGNDKVVNGQVVRSAPSLEERLYPNWKV